MSIWGMIVGDKEKNGNLWQSFRRSLWRIWQGHIDQKKRAGRSNLDTPQGKRKPLYFQTFSGSSEVYRKLLTVSCPNLPQIMEVGEKEGKTALLEEYVQGDTLGEILQGGLLTAAQAKQITRQLCMALWVLHSLGVVHRDVKPDNVIIRGTEAVLIDFDASRIYKNENIQLYSP